MIVDSDNNELVITVFEYQSQAGISTVSLVGCWDNWTVQIPMEKRKDSDVWFVEKELAVGDVTFKFVTDGKWVACKDYDLIADGHGGENNIRKVEKIVDASSAEDEPLTPEEDKPISEENEKTDETKPVSDQHKPHDDNGCILC